ncbi:MAG: acyl-CoA thioesterase [Desulfurococcaceae archaeon]|nr:MAG: acyl-CoA thioesterase [Desulfurococcaceae archaeon]
MPFEARYRVYWSETDAAGIAHFTSILRIVERAEEDLYRSKGLGEVHRLIPRIEVHARYRSPLRWGDEIRVRLELDEARSRGLRYKFEIYNETTGKHAAEGYVAFACVEKEDNGIRAVECPKELINLWMETKAGSQPHTTDPRA